MKRTARLLSLLIATLLVLTACSTAEEAGEAPSDSASEALEAVEEESPPSGSVEEESVPPADTSTSDQTIAELAGENPQLSQLVAAVEAAGLTDALEQAGPITVFAPNNDAFASLNQSDLTALLADPASLGDILQYHVVEGSYPSSELTDGQTLTTLQGGDLTVSIDGDTVKVNNDATVLQADLQAGNGVIHVIDTVLQP